MFSRYMSGVLLKRCIPNYSCETVVNAHHFSQHCGKMRSKFKLCSHKMSAWLRDQSVQVVKVCTKQFEFIAVQRIRRSVQIFHLYTKIWDEVALKEFIRSWRRRTAKNTKDFLFGAVGVTMFNWDKDRITDKELYSYSQEIDGIHRLRDATVVCSDCQLRLVVDIKQPGINYCNCSKSKCAVYKAEQSETEWTPFLERQDMLIWRKEEKDHGGLYSYKVYGSFNDVSAEDFLQVQIDVDYRRKWDTTAAQLEVIDKDPAFSESMESRSDIVYWETIWPRLFSNRDYVFQRRWHYDKETGVVIIVNKGVDHPNAPNRSDTQRVKNYWSYMVVKPYTNFHEPGIEFGLTYFEDSGVRVPSAFVSWIAVTGFPNYLCEMRQAGKDYKAYKALHETENKISKRITIDNLEEKMNVKDINNEDHSKENDQNNKVIIDISSDRASKENLSSTQSIKTALKETNKSKIENDKHDEKKDEETEEEEEDEESIGSDSTLNEDQGFLNYFFLAKLFV